MAGKGGGREFWCKESGARHCSQGLGNAHGALFYTNTLTPQIGVPMPFLKKKQEKCAKIWDALAAGKSTKGAQKHDSVISKLLFDLHSKGPGSFRKQNSCLR